MWTDIIISVFYIAKKRKEIYMSEVGTSVINMINTILDERLKKLKYDKTFKSTIWGKNEDGTYQISYMNQLYNVYNALGTDLELGQSVWVKIPSGIFRNMHICGVNYKKRRTK